MKISTQLKWLAILVQLVQYSSTECALGCNDRGLCRQNKCICDSGFYDDGSNSLSDCSKAINVEFKESWVAFQVVFTLLYMICIIIAVLGSIAHYHTRTATAVNIRRTVMILVALTSLSRILNTLVDARFLSPRTKAIPVSFILSNFHYPVGITIFLCVLFHWIDLYNTSVATLRREQMIQKINANYHGKAITVEEIVAKVKFLTKLRIPFIVITLVSIIIFVIGFIISFMGAYEIFVLILVSYMSLCYLIFSIGFLVYGRKLVQLMPRQAIKQVHKLTRRMTFITSYCLVCIIILGGITVAVMGNSGAVFFWIRTVSLEIAIFLTLLALELVFARWSKNGKFPYCIQIGSTKDTSGTSHDLKENSSTSKQDMSSI